VTDPNTDRLNKSRTLSWTRDSREGRASSTIPASKLLESGRGLRILTGINDGVPVPGRILSRSKKLKAGESSLVNTPSLKINRKHNKQKIKPYRAIQPHISAHTPTPASPPPYHFPYTSPSVNTPHAPDVAQQTTIAAKRKDVAARCHPAAQRGCHPTLRNTATRRVLLAHALQPTTNPEALSAQTNVCKHCKSSCARASERSAVCEFATLSRRA
jgi:hypothetical protein